VVAPDIFYVEDNEDFAFIMEHAVAAVDEKVTLNIIPNGNEALEILHAFAETGQKPSLILLDLNLPGMSGLDLMKNIKEMHFFTGIPLVIFSTSDEPKDIRASLELGATAYLTKPNGYIDLIACLRSIFDRWL
jgi:CheY-like chemotaxis protein